MVIIYHNSQNLSWSHILDDVDDVDDVHIDVDLHVVSFADVAVKLWQRNLCKTPSALCEVSYGAEPSALSAALPRPLAVFLQ